MNKDLERFLADARELSLRREEKESIAKTLGIRVREKTSLRHEPYMSEKRFFSAASKVRLHPAERARCKEYILEAIMHPTLSWWVLPFKHLTSVVAAFLIVILAGGATITYASESSLPGDVLYPVKINISEPMQGMLARNPESQARFAAKRAFRRLREAEQLARSSTMTEDTKVMIAKHFKEHAEDMERALGSLESGNNRPMAGAISMDFEATLRGHARLFKKMQNKKHDFDVLEQEVRSARMSVEEVAIRVNMAEEHNDLRTVTAEHAEETLTEATAVIAEQEHASEEAKEALVVAENALKEAKESTSGPEAIDLMRTAIRNAKEAVVLAEVAPEIAAESSLTLGADVPTEPIAAEAETMATDVATPPSMETAAFSTGEVPSVMMMKATPPVPPMVPFMEELPPPPFHPDAFSEDMQFSMEVRMHMAKKKLKHLKEAMDHMPPPMDPNDLIDVEARMGGAEQLLSIAEMQQEAGNAPEALDAADTALRHVHKAEEHMEEVK